MYSEIIMNFAGLLLSIVFSLLLIYFMKKTSYHTPVIIITIFVLIVGISGIVTQIVNTTIDDETNNSSNITLPKNAQIDNIPPNEENLPPLDYHEYGD